MACDANVMMLICYAYVTLTMLTLHLLCLHYTINIMSMYLCRSCHHVVNTIKGGSRPLFIIGSADLKLITSVLFCLPQVNKCFVLLFLIHNK